MLTSLADKCVTSDELVHLTGGYSYWKFNDYRINPEKCTGCQRCVQVCPTGAITGPRSEVHNLDESTCIKCRSCYEVCRFDASAGDAITIES